MVANKKQLDAKSKLFCYYYAVLGNCKEAGIKAGFPTLLAEKRGLSLLSKPEVLEEIDRISKERRLSSQAKNGLFRLAFGSISDAIRLIQCEDDFKTLDLNTLDLFNISEIKKAKGGGFEIKFFDRFKALDRLCELEVSEDTSASLPFFEALEKSANNLSQEMSVDIDDI
ncbi:MAG: terminase small subunit [Oscillospiraceae bacterium]|nr:terminase small subunit [Oscillospiraceae bacterium]